MLICTTRLFLTMQFLTAEALIAQQVVQQAAQQVAQQAALVVALLAVPLVAPLVALLVARSETLLMGYGFIPLFYFYAKQNFTLRSIIPNIIKRIWQYNYS